MTMKKGKSAPASERWWRRVDKRGDDECWPWLGSVNKQGYGMFEMQHKPIRALTSAHRAGWIYANGHLDRWELVCHRCDNPICVNPRHLFVGTPLDNTADMMSKGRAPMPAGGRPQKTTLAQRNEMRKAHAEGSHPVELAVKYGLSTSTTYDVLHYRRSYKSECG